MVAVASALLPDDLPLFIGSEYRVARVVTRAKFALDPGHAPQPGLNPCEAERPGLRSRHERERNHRADQSLAAA